MAPLSVIASSFIIRTLIKKKDIDGTYRRLLFSRSAFDVMFSLWYMLGPLPVLEETTGWLGARGNQASCTASGFFNFFITVELAYNICLSLYFLMKIRYNVREQILVYRVEPVMHILSIGVSLGIASAAVAMEVLNPIGLGLTHCFVGAFPPYCDLIEGLECIRGESHKVFAWAAIIFPTIILFGVMCWSLFAIYRASRTQYKKSEASSLRSSQAEGLRLVARQAQVYILGFFLPSLFVLVSMSFETMASAETILSSEHAIYPIQVLGEIFLPLQGVFNLLAFLTPRYMRIRSLHGDKSLWWAVKLTFSPLQEVPLPRRRTSTPLCREATGQSTEASASQHAFAQRSLANSSTGQAPSNNSGNLDNSTTSAPPPEDARMEQALPV